MIIGLVGKARSGKDTFANMLYRKMDSNDILFLTYSFAGELKARMMEDFELDNEQVNGNLKEVPDPRYPKKGGGHWTPREILQFMGTDAYRAIDEHFWVKQLMKTIDRSTNRKDGDQINFIITDCRFPDEIRAVEDRNGVIIKIVREQRDIITNTAHASETALDNYNFRNVIVVDNSGSKHALNKEVDRVISILNLNKLKTVSGGN